MIKKTLKKNVIKACAVFNCDFNRNLLKCTHCLTYEALYTYQLLFQKPYIMHIFCQVSCMQRPNLQLEYIINSTFTFCSIYTYNNTSSKK